MTGRLLGGCGIFGGHSFPLLAIHCASLLFVVGESQAFSPLMGSHRNCANTRWEHCGSLFPTRTRDLLAKFYLLDRRGRRRYMGNIDTVICQRGCITLVSSVLMRFVRSRPGTLNCRRRPADVVIEHKKRATAVWVVLLLSILGCKEYNVFMRIWSP